MDYDNVYVKVNPNTFYVIGSNSTTELQARTFIAAHENRQALDFREFSGPNEKGETTQFTMVTASYLADQQDNDSFLSLLEEMVQQLGENEALMLVANSGGYIQQPVFLIFPYDKSTTNKCLASWLLSNHRFLDDRTELKSFLLAEVDNRMNSKVSTNKKTG